MEQRRAICKATISASVTMTASLIRWLGSSMIEALAEAEPETKLR